MRKTERLAILERDGYTCRYCGVALPRYSEDSRHNRWTRRMSATRAHVDHVWPKAHGGTDASWNLVAACASCNLRKGATLTQRTRAYERRLFDADAARFAAQIDAAEWASYEQWVDTQAP